MLIRITVSVTASQNLVPTLILADPEQMKRRLQSTHVSLSVPQTVSKTTLNTQKYLTLNRGMSAEYLRT